MNGPSLLICLLLIFVVLPGAVTLLVPKRWFPVWVAVVALFVLWIWNEPFDGPGGGFAFGGILVISVLNGIVMVGRVMKLAFDHDREQ